MNLTIQPNVSPFLFLNDLIKIQDDIITMPIHDQHFDWVYDVHWPNKPNIPASLQLETMTQAAAMYIFLHFNPQYVFVREFISCKFFRMITPGLSLTLSLQLTKHKRSLFYYSGSILDGNTNQIYTKASFILINPDLMPSM